MSSCSPGVGGTGDATATLGGMSEWPPFPPPNPPQQPGVPQQPGPSEQPRLPPTMPQPPAAPAPTQPYGSPAIPPPPVAPGPPPSYGGSPYGGPPSATWYLPHAGFGARLGGFIIDGLVVMGVMIPFYVLVVALGIATYESEVGTCTDYDGRSYLCDVPTGGTIMSWIVFGLAAVVVGLAATYFVRIRPLPRTGQTIGRRAMNIRVIREDTGGLLSIGQALGREAFAAFVSGQVFYLGYLWMLWDDKKQTWQDKVVGSVVVRTDAA